jgi:hypothetical protein
MSTQDESSTKRTMTFAVKEVRTHSSGETNGRKWTKYLVFANEGEILGTFDGDWKLFEGDTVSVEVTEKLFGGKPYLSVGRPPGASPAPGKSKKAAPEPLPPVQMPLFTVGKFEDILTRIDANVLRVMERLDAIAAALVPQPAAPTTEGKEEQEEIPF